MKVTTGFADLDRLFNVELPMYNDLLTAGIPSEQSLRIAIGDKRANEAFEILKKIEVKKSIEITNSIQELI